MSVNTAGFGSLVHHADWPYVVRNDNRALLYMLLKGLPVLHEWFSVFMAMVGIRRGLASRTKLQDDPQLALIDDDGMQRPRVRGRGDPIAKAG